MLSNTRFLNPENFHSSDLSRADQFQVQIFMQFFRRQLGKEEEKWTKYYPLIDTFLKVAHHQHLDMTWKLNLAFLKWMVTTHSNKVTKEFVDYQCLRAAFNWCHTYHEDIEIRGILIQQPYLNSTDEVWIGLKEENPLGKIKVFKATLKNKEIHDSISYAKFLDSFQTLAMTSLQWETL